MPSDQADQKMWNDYEVGVAEPGHTYGSSKIYTHAHGLSCAFRQWRAESHCNRMHGYSIQAEVEFADVRLDDRNWVMDFGGLKPIKTWLEDTFDHKTLVAKDDPQISLFREMHIAKIIDMVEVQAVGCEAFARMLYEKTRSWLVGMGYKTPIYKATIREHGGNAASYGRKLDRLTLDDLAEIQKMIKIRAGVQ